MSVPSYVAALGGLVKSEPLATWKAYLKARRLDGMAQVMPLPSMEELRADLKKARTDTGRADLMLNLALSYVFRTGEEKSDLDSAAIEREGFIEVAQAGLQA